MGAPSAVIVDLYGGGAKYQAVGIEVMRAATLDQHRAVALGADPLRT
jgi:hypothetical protein